MTNKKYRTKYTNAQDCEHAVPESTDMFLASVEVLETCHMYDKLPLNLVPIRFCQNECQQYENRDE